MAKQRQRSRQEKDWQRPRFMWQALLIVLPLVLLTTVASYFLWQDRQLVESEARRRAQEYARATLEECRFRFTSAINQPGFSCNERGDDLRWGWEDVYSVCGHTRYRLRDAPPRGRAGLLRRNDVVPESRSPNQR